MKKKLIEDIESLKQSAKFMRITNDITPTGLNAINMGLDALIEVVKNISSKPLLADSVCDCILPDYYDEKGEWCKRCNAKIL